MRVLYVRQFLWWNPRSLVTDVGNYTNRQTAACQQQINIFVQTDVSSSSQDRLAIGSLFYYP